MAHWKSNLIDTYRWATWPYRKMRLNQMKRAGQVPVAILFYHRIDDTHLNPWTISEEDFHSQIDWYEKNFDLVDLEECQRRISQGYNDRPTLSITFDDGYADNCAFALPMLISRGIPVTYFVTTFHTTNNRPFAHDVELNCPLAPNSIESLIALSKAGVEIGSHSRHHTDLGKLVDMDQLFDEVIRATEEMESVIDNPIRYFAFPYGQRENLNPAVFRMLKKHGFKGVCSAYGGLNDIGEDSFHLQRIHGDPSLARMKNWLTFDPRLKNIARYQYETVPETAVTPASVHETTVLSNNTQLNQIPVTNHD